MGCHALLQGILPTQESDLHFLHCRQILYHFATRETQAKLTRHRIISDNLSKHSTLDKAKVTVL